MVHLRGRSRLVLVLLAAVGCSGPGEVGQSNYSAFRGRLIALEAAGLDQTMWATEEAMKRLAMKPMITDRDAFTAKVVGEVTKGTFGQAHEVVVRLRREAEGRTELDLHIRGRRDQALLQSILEDIRKLLGEQALKGK